jgi:hypothetical protein
LARANDDRLALGTANDLGEGDAGQGRVLPKALALPGFAAKAYGTAGRPCTVVSTPEGSVLVASGQRMLGFALDLSTSKSIATLPTTSRRVR